MIALYMLMMTLVYSLFHHYLNRLEAARCTCATSHALFPWLRALTATLGLLYTVAFVCIAAGWFNVAAAFVPTCGFVALVTGVFMAWSYKMYRLRCVCANSAEFRLWNFLVALEFVPVGALLTCLVASALRRA